jgi:hypothetical protein
MRPIAAIVPQIAAMIVHISHWSSLVVWINFKKVEGIMRKT